VDDKSQIQGSVIGIVLMVVGGAMLLLSDSWIGYIGALLAIAGAATVVFVFFRSKK
jgi:hypothetical protein